MTLPLLMGLFLLVLAAIFGVAAQTASRQSKGQTTPAIKTRRRIALIFAVIGLVLILGRLTFG